MKTLQHGSSSQVELFRECQRKYHFSRVLDIPTPTTKGAIIGGETHIELDHYLTTGKAPGPIATAGIHRLPRPPVPSHNVEAFAAFVGGDLVVPYVMKIDLLEPDVKRVTDHKTTKNVKYMKTAEELSHNVQAIGYSAYASALFAGTAKTTGGVYTSSRGDSYPLYTPSFDGDPVRFRHVYYLTTGRPRSFEVETSFTTDQLREGFAGIAKTLVDIKDNYKKRVEDVPTTPSACANYGGCPFIQQCNAADGGGPFAALFKLGGQTMNFTERLAAAQKAKQAALPAVNPPDGVPEFDQFNDQKDAAKKDVFPAQLGDIVSGADLPGLDRALINCPIKSLKKAALVELARRLRYAVGARKKLKKQLASRDAENAPASTRNGLKTEVAFLIDLLMQQIEPDAPASAPAGALATPDQPDEKIPPSGVNRPDSIILVGCLPRKADVTYIEEMIAPIARAAAEKLGVPHYRVTEYGRGLDSIIGIFASRLDAGDLALPPFLFIDPSSHYGLAIRDVLAGRDGVTLIERFGS